MKNIFAIQAIILDSNNSEVVKYFHYTKGHELAGKDAVQLLFPQNLSEATLFDDHTLATTVFETFIADVTKEANGKTMFEPPFSILVGGEHTRRVVSVTLDLVCIHGVNLLNSTISTERTVKLQGEEYSDGTPYTIRMQGHVNLVFEDNIVADYDVTVPEMMDGDTYHKTRIDHVLGRVIHEAYSKAGLIVIYTCTKQGNLLHRVAPNVASPVKADMPYMG